MDVTIKKGETSIKFPYYGSHMDALTVEDFYKTTKSIQREITDSFKKWSSWEAGESFAPKKQNSARYKMLEGLAYSILCSCSCELMTPPLFEDFCADFGYDEDSREAFNLWQRCLRHSSRLHKIFKESDIDCLPR